jgi:peptidyl-prolyl cis-trans isomerase C
MKVNQVIMLVICGSLVTMAGCDLLNPKKTEKVQKSEKAVVNNRVAPVTEKTANANANDKTPLPAGVLAKVGDWTISQDEFNDRIKAVKETVKDFNEKEAGAKAMLLNELVRQQLLIQQARKERAQDSADIKAAMKEFENTLLVQEIVTRLTKDVAVTDDDAKKYYTDNPNEFKKPMEKRLREIVVSTQSEANDILVQALQGGDFAQIAKEKSKGKTAADGGDLGVKTEAPFAAMATAVANLKKGGISSVFEGPEGFYIVKVEDILGGEQVAFDDVKADLLNFLKLRKQQELLAAKIKEIQQEIKVQVNEDLLKE